MENSVLQSVRDLLEREQVTYQEIHHPPTHTSEESGRARGVPLRIGGKALVLKLPTGFGVFVMSAARRLDSGAVKRHLRAKKLRFASAEELFTLTGLVPGAVPPFARPVLPFENLYADESVLENDFIAFNAGALTCSFILRIEDYRRVAQPVVLTFTRPEDAAA